MSDKKQKAPAKKPDKKGEACQKRIPKPQLGGHLLRQSGVNIAKAIVGSAVSGILFQIFWKNKRVNLYKEFYETYDIDYHFERMRAKGLFDSC